MEKQKKNIEIAITLVVVTAILVYLINAIFNLIKNPTDTFLVENGRISSQEETQGYIIRDEEVIIGQNYKNGMSKIKSEGERVSKGEAIFRYYTSGEEELLNKIKELDVKIQEAWSNESNIPRSDIKLLDNQIEQRLNSIYELNNLERVSEYKKEIDEYITKKAKIAGNLSPAGSYLKSLIEERSKYENTLYSGSEYVKATKSGVVSYRVDGLEEILSPTDFSKITKDVLENLNLKTGQVVSTSEEGGKVIDNFNCYIACILNSDQALNSVVGEKVTLRLYNAQEVTAEIEYTSKETSKEILIIFKIDKNIEDLINYRKISVDVIWWDSTGLKIPNSALKYENDNLIYVIRKRANYTDKIYVKILKQNESYAIIENYTDYQELLDKGVPEEEANLMRKISLYDEILS